MTASADQGAPTIPTAADLLLVVDAGGTKTAAWLVDLSRPEIERIIGRGRSAAGNPLSVGFDEAARAVSEAVNQARGAMEEPAAPVSRVVLSIAGAANPKISNRFLNWLQPLKMAQRAAIVSDVLPVLAAGSPKCEGVALIAGTGSVAFGRDATGKTALCGGWGFLLGDEGSAYDIGRAALRHALHQLEADTSPDPLSTTVLTILDATSVMELTRTAYTSADPRTTIAALAPLVLESSGKAAGAIVEAAAADLANLVCRVTKLVELPEKPFPLAVAGGLLVNSSRLQQQLRVELQRREFDCHITVVEDPLAGCVRLAAPEFAEALLKWHNT